MLSDRFDACFPGPTDIRQLITPVTTAPREPSGAPRRCVTREATYPEHGHSGKAAFVRGYEARYRSAIFRLSVQGSVLYATEPLGR